MTGWLTLSGINKKSISVYEHSLKTLRLDEGNHNMSLQQQLVPLLFHKHPNDARKFLNCLGEQSEKCRSRPPCRTGGRCLLNNTGNYYCKCRDGFTGNTCQHDVNECVRGLHKCNKSAKCINNNGSYICRCKPGFTGNGHQCKEMDECKSQPCANKGTCHNHINQFTCTCKAGFKGKTCTEDIDECASSPCKNNGTCFNEVNAFTCRCPIQFEGKTCEKKWFSQKLFHSIKNEISRVFNKTTTLENKLENMTQTIFKVLNTVETALYPGQTASNAALSCSQIRKLVIANHGDGFYWIRPLNYSGSPYRAYCDMTTQGGGWTLFATKVSYDFVFPTTKFNPSSASSIMANAKGCIHPGTQWSDVLFRFGPKPSPVQTIYSRHGGQGSPQKNEFNQFLECKKYNKNGNVDGYVKYSPHSNGGRRTPPTGFYNQPKLHYYTRHGITGNHQRADYVDLWHNPGGSYDAQDHSNARGTKCIASVCYLNRPVWLMYR